MLRVNPAFTDESVGLAQSRKIVVALASMACCLFSTGCGGFSQGGSTSPFVITTSSVSSAVEAIPYSTALSASGGQPPYEWSVVSGALPAGIEVSATTG